MGVILKMEKVREKVARRVITLDDLIPLLRCQRTDCDSCPMYWEERVEQDLYRMRCAAHDAADELERRRSCETVPKR